MRVATAAAAALFVMLAPSAAVAAGSGSAGVHVDPGSPSQHQYVIPVNAARSETNGGHHGSGSGSQLFGNGIKPGSNSSSGSNGASGASNAKAKAKAKAKAHNAKTKKGSHTPRYALASSSGRPPSGPSSSGSGGDGGSGWLPLAAGGALVLVIGCGGGFALRRRILRA